MRQNVCKRLKARQMCVDDENHINVFGRFIVYGLAKIQRNSKYLIALVISAAISAYNAKITFKSNCLRFLVVK